MALGKGKPKRKREPRANQFGITLSDRMAEALRDRAAQLDTPPTTLARTLLEQALSERVSDGQGQGSVGKFEARSHHPIASDSALEAILTELRALSESQRNATLKLLRQSGMSIASVKDWAEEYLK